MLKVTLDEPFGKDDILNGLMELDMGEWRRKYDNPIILDGTQWSLEIYFSNDFKDVKIYGSNIYPYNFEGFCNLMGVEWKL